MNNMVRCKDASNEKDDVFGEYVGDEIDLVAMDAALAKQMQEDFDREALEERRKREEEDAKYAQELQKQFGGGGEQQQNGHSNVDNGGSDEDFGMADLFGDDYNNVKPKPPQPKKYDPNMVDLFGEDYANDSKSRQDIEDEDFKLALKMTADPSAFSDMDPETAALARQMMEEEDAAIAMRMEKENADMELARALEEELNKPPPKPVYQPPPPPVYNYDNEYDSYDGEDGAPAEFNEEGNVIIPAAPAPVGNLTASLEGVVDSSSDSSDVLKAVSDYSHFRYFLSVHKDKIRLRRVTNNAMEAHFLSRWEYLKQKYGHDHEFCVPRIAFHGTRTKFIPLIEKGGLKVPEQNNGVSHTNDSGWWGKGIYVSYDPEYSRGYSEDGRLIVCAVLLGKPYNCVQRRDGGALEDGYDSHIAEGGKEFVLFENESVLPMFVIDFKGNIKRL